VQAGFGPYFVHRTGHGIGLEVHESPSVTSANPEPMQVGMAFSIEPGIYLPNQFGVRLEEVVIVQPHGARVLSKIPRAVHVVAV
jgi:Xaa-Pro aminopeptidase